MVFLAWQHSGELQNLVERSVILSRDGVLRTLCRRDLQTSATMLSSIAQSSQSPMTLEDSDRALILKHLSRPAGS